MNNVKSYSFIAVLVLLCSLSVSAQKTRVFELDLAAPHEESFKCVDGCRFAKGDFSFQNRLTIPSKKLIALKLKNANPFKYSYQLNGTGIDLFSDFESGFSETQKRLEETVVKARPA